MTENELSIYIHHSDEPLKHKASWQKDKDLREHPSGYYGEYYRDKKRSYLRSLELISRDKKRQITINNFGGCCRNWYQLWKRELEVFRKMFLSDKKTDKIFGKIDKHNKVIIDFHLGIWNKSKSRAYSEEEKLFSDIYKGWKFITIKLGYHSVYDIITDEMSEQLKKMHIYIDDSYDDDGKYLFFYKHINEKNISRTIKICLFMLEQSIKVLERERRTRDNYLKKYKPWKMLESID